VSASRVSVAPASRVERLPSAAPMFTASREPEVGSPTMPSRVPAVGSFAIVLAVPPADRSEIDERAAPSAIAPPTEKALLIRWSTPSDMSLLESPLRIAAISSAVRLKPRSAAAGSD